MIRLHRDLSSIRVFLRSAPLLEETHVSSEAGARPPILDLNGYRDQHEQPPTYDGERRRRNSLSAPARSPLLTAENRQDPACGRIVIIGVKGPNVFADRHSGKAQKSPAYGFSSLRVGSLMPRAIADRRRSKVPDHWWSTTYIQGNLNALDRKTAWSRNRPIACAPTSRRLSHGCAQAGQRRAKIRHMQPKIAVHSPSASFVLDDCHATPWQGAKCAPATNVLED